MQKTKSEIIPHYESHWGTQNQMRLENYPQCATQCATQWGSQKHMKRAIVIKKFQCSSEPTALMYLKGKFKWKFYFFFWLIFLYLKKKTLTPFYITIKAEKLLEMTFKILLSLSWKIWVKLNQHEILNEFGTSVNEMVLYPPSST